MSGLSARKLELVPKELAEVLNKLKKRHDEIVKLYRSLANYGRPLFEDLREIATVVYLNEKLGIGLNEIAYYIGLTKETLYNMMKKLEQGKVSIYNRETNRVEVIQVSKDQLISIVEEMLNVKARAEIDDPLKSAIIREFLEKPIEKRAKMPGHGEYLSDEHKKETLRVVKFFMRVIREMNEKRQEKLPVNPDLWTKEVILAVIDYCDKNNVWKSKQQRYNYLSALGRIPQFTPWLEGKIGAVTKVISPVMRVIYYEDFIKLKRYYMENEPQNINELLVVFLHIATGAREGWKSCKEYLETCTSSLVGIKVKDVTRVGSSIMVKIWENKTQKWWTADITWLDRELSEMLYQRISGKDQNKAVVEVLTGISKVKEFARWYGKVLSKISKLLNLGYKLTPHDMRRSHISILAELGVPMEYAVSGQADFGVGWEDLKTCAIFYLRFSKLTKERIRAEMERVKEQIISRL